VLEKLKVEQAAWEAEREKKTLEEIERRAKKIEDRIFANYDRLRAEVMRLYADRLASIKDKEERIRKMNNLAVIGVEVLAEEEEEKREEQVQDSIMSEIEASCWIKNNNNDILEMFELLHPAITVRPDSVEMTIKKKIDLTRLFSVLISGKM